MVFTDVLNAVLTGIQIELQRQQIKLIKWLLFKNGWVHVGRIIGFRIDLRIVKYFGIFYDYFFKMLDRDIFNQEVAGELIKNVYVFIGVIMVFRLMMLLMKYLINPDLTSDAKLGVSSFIRRVIIGCVGILFIPTIFDLSLELQSAILKDNLIQKIVIPKDILPRITRVQQRGGKYIATYIQAGFITPANNAPNLVKKMYKTGLQNGDLSSLRFVLDFGILQDVDNCYVNYVPIVSTLVLAYALMTMAKYCIDLATRCLRLLLYKLLTPVAMIEYMIKGADDGVFKKWKSAIISTYVSLFVRVMALWCVIFVTGLMQADSTDKYVANSLLDNPDDTLLRAIIIVALLGFMMDLPKMVGSVFDLDLEQAGSADGLFKTITGLVKTGYIGGLGLAATRIGAMASTTLTAAKGGAAFLDKYNEKHMGLNDAAKDKWKNDHKWASNAIGFLNDNPFAQGIASSRAATSKSIMGLSPITKSLYEGAAGSWGATTAGYDKKESGNKEKEKAKAAEARDIAREQREQRQETREMARDILHEVERNADIGRYTVTEADGTTRAMKLDEIYRELRNDYTHGFPTAQTGLKDSLNDSVGAKQQAIDTADLASRISVQLSDVGINLTGEQAQQLSQQIFQNAFASTNPQALTPTAVHDITTEFKTVYNDHVNSLITNHLGVGVPVGAPLGSAAVYINDRGTTPDISLINTPGRADMVHGINNEPLESQATSTTETINVLHDIKVDTGAIRVSGDNISLDTADIRGKVSNIDLTTQNISTTTQNIDTTTQNINTTAQNINTTTQNIDKTTQNIDTTTQNINTTTQNIDKTTQNIDKTTQNINITTRNIKKDTKKISDNTKP